MGEFQYRYPDRIDTSQQPPTKGYALSGKIMLSAIIILFFVVIIMVCLHLYARWYLLRARRRNLRRNRRNRRTHILFHDSPTANTLSATTRGLDLSILNSLPVFVHSSKMTTETQEQPILECAVCLSEFEDDERGRLLPKCKHSFHIECIDMWFSSHSTCPLCRAPVETGSEIETRPDVVLNVGEPDGSEPGPSSELCSECCNSETTSSGSRRKPLNIMVPRRNESFGRAEDCGESPASQSFRSPMSRMLSFRRMLSRDRRNDGVSPSAGINAVGFSSVAESDIEVGGRQGTECNRSE